MSEQTSKYWLDQVVVEIEKAHPKGEVILSSGVSPSGIYHLGTLRELVTTDALTRALRARGRKARHLHFVDDFDVFRKVPVAIGVPESFEKYLGSPLYLVPDPFGDCHDSYVEHLLPDLQAAKERLNLDMDIIRSHQEYQVGKFADAIKTVAAKGDRAKAVIFEVSERQLGDDWTPFQLLQEGRLKNNYPVKWDDGVKQLAESGKLKLDWRLDWPARWQIWNVQVEPFGRDHATKGGSYDTGKELAKEIFGGKAPYPVPYDFINLAGETKKMSKSSGTGVSMRDALDIMPPEILRYFILRSRPEKLLVFDSQIGLFNLIDEFSKVQEAVTIGQPHEFKEAYEMSVGSEEPVISRVPFNHLVSVWQAARGDSEKALELLERTGHATAVKDQKDVIVREFDFVSNWLTKFAPEEIKFSVQDQLPKVELAADQTKFTDLLADRLEQAGELDGQAMHDLIYDSREIADIKPQEAFQALYRLILGKDSGPKAGWFLASLERTWLIRRLRRQA